MEKTDRIIDIEAEYGMEIDDLLHKLYAEREYSQRELADELDIPRSSLQYWLREAGVEMRRRTLSDVQRIAILVLLPYLPSHRIAERVGCATVTVRRYQREITNAERDAADPNDMVPVDLDLELTDRDYDLLTPTTAAQWVNVAPETGETDADADADVAPNADPTTPTTSTTNDSH